MGEEITVWHLVISVIVAIISSSALAAWITSRASLRSQDQKWKQTIHDEVRASLRRDLDATEGHLREAIQELNEQREQHRAVLLDVGMLCSHVRWFTRKVTRLVALVVKSAPAHSDLAHEVREDSDELLRMVNPWLPRPPNPPSNKRKKEDEP